MFEKAKRNHDAFTFSLGGMTAAVPFAAVPIIADDRINRILDERLKKAEAERAKKPRAANNAQAAQPACA